MAFDYGNVLRDVENVLNARYMRSPQNPRNRLAQLRINALLQGGGAPDPTAVIQNYQFRENLSPEQRKVFDSVQRAQQIREIGGVQTIVSPTGLQQLSDLETEAGAKRRLSGATERGKQEQILKFKPEIESDVLKKKAKTQKEIDKPKRLSAVGGQRDRTALLKENLALARKQAGAFTTGFLGAQMQNVPGTPAHDLANTLSTLKANAGFERLQEMRNNSKTGGALGQVSERELQLLQDAYAALSQSQSKGQFMQNLNKFERQVDQSWKRVKLAYRLDYGEDYSDDTEITKTVDWNDL